MLIVIKTVFWDYKVLMSWGVRSKVADIEDEANDEIEYKSDNRNNKHESNDDENDICNIKMKMMLLITSVSDNEPKLPTGRVGGED